MMEASCDVTTTFQQGMNDEQQQHVDMDPTKLIPSPEKPRRNLTRAFEALCLDEPGDNVQGKPFGISTGTDILSPGNNSSVTMKESATLISPTNVADFGLNVNRVSPILEKDVIADFPDIDIHPGLRRDLSIYCVRRVSSYNLIHDINKEGCAMAQHDPIVNLADEKDSPLVVASKLDTLVIPSMYYSIDPTKVKNAIIDEEKWILSAISNRSIHETRSVNADCPSTFLQAMGEKEYDNPAQSVTGQSRTQLWKPSRSWWEAKSGKNPWIEPSCHNKRWRYLWPLIHFHKFLAKCIKKLKRNGVDVKSSISPVSVFLREEVCAVSDHLAAVSLFDSDEWMDYLQQFNGWTAVSDSAEDYFREFVAHLTLRDLSEQGDVDSPILRSQIDEKFLRTMVAQREQLREANAIAATGAASANIVQMSPTKQEHDLKLPTVEQETMASATAISSGQPPIYPRVSPQAEGVPRQIQGIRRPRYFPPPGGWYSWDGQHYQDNSSVHSELSANSFPQQNPHYDFNRASSNMYHLPAPGHPPPGYYQPMGTHPGSTDHSHSSDGYSYQNGFYHNASQGWFDPYMSSAYTAQTHLNVDGYYNHPVAVTPGQVSPEATNAREFSHSNEGTQGVGSYPTEFTAYPIENGTPYKYDPENTMKQSPFWSHLDQATIAMGLATPGKPPSPITPARRDDKRDDLQDSNGSISLADAAEYAVTAQPPLLRQHYYSHANYMINGFGGGMYMEGYVPPSPATQFMMSPHAYPPSSYAYNYANGFSPRRPGRPVMTPRNIASKTIPEKGTLSTPLDTNRFASMMSLASSTKQQRERQSPSTVETTDSETIFERPVTSKV